MKFLNWLWVVLLACTSLSASVLVVMPGLELMRSMSSEVTAPLVLATIGHGISLYLAGRCTRDAAENHCVRAGVALVPSAVVAAGASFLVVIAVDIDGWNHRTLPALLLMWAGFVSPVAVVVSACRERFVPHRKGAHRTAGLGWPAVCTFAIAILATGVLLILPA